MAKSKLNKNIKKRILTIVILLNVGILVFLKYANFFIFNIQGILQLMGVEQNSIILNLILPLGISFYTFQSVGYLLDVYWGKVKAEQNIFKIGLFISYFPQIVQGPISRYSDLAPQFDQKHEFNYEQVLRGAQLILWGLFKKLVIADVLAGTVDIVFGSVATVNGAQSILGVIAYLVQDYTDFSGCIDIVRGVSACFGIELKDNFERPYFSLSIPEYWRRWHITLGTWFKDYIFYPISISKFSLKLGKFGKKVFGEKAGKQLPAIFGLLVTWLTTGLWHGASWNYVLWGIFYGVIIILGILFKPIGEKIVQKLKINTNAWWYKTFLWCRTIWILCVGRIIFRCASIADSWTLFAKTFSVFKYGLQFNTWYEIVPSMSSLITCLVACAVLLAVEIYKEKHPNVSILKSLHQKNTALQTVVILALFVSIILFGAYGAGFNAKDFVYMQY